MRKRQRAGLTGVLAVTVAAAAALPSSGILVNHTASMSRGVWLLHRAAAVYHTGDIVVACPPLTERQAVYFERGTCLTGFQPVVKTVAAVAGDTVVVTSGGVAINGADVPNSAARPKDGAGRTLQAYPAGIYTVAHGQVWLLSSAFGSFDSRYLGPVSTAVIRGTATPLWVWP